MSAVAKEKKSKIIVEVCSKCGHRKSVSPMRKDGFLCRDCQPRWEEYMDWYRDSRYRFDPKAWLTLFKLFLCGKPCDLLRKNLPVNPKPKRRRRELGDTGTPKTVDIPLVFQLTNEGLSTVKIAKELDVSPQIVQKVLKGVHWSQRKPRGTKKRKLPLAKIMAMHKEGKSKTKIAEAIDCSPKSIRRVLKGTHWQVRDQKQNGSTKAKPRQGAGK